MAKRIASILAGLVLLFVFVSKVSAYYTNMPANVVVGQIDFSVGSANKGGSPDASTLANPYDVIVVNGKMIVSDFSNNRVLIYNSVPKSNNTLADVVIGQASFSGSSGNQGLTRAANTLSGPQGIFSDGTRLFIADGINNRVLIYNSIPTINNASADVVVGQNSFSNGTANQGGTAGANTLNAPSDVYVYNSKLFIVDDTNHRVLIYNSIPTANNASADVVIGQQTFSAVSANQGGSPAANTLWFPAGVEVSNGKLIISEINTGGNGNKRLLVFNSIPTTNNAFADVVVFQPDFSSNSVNQGGAVSANTIAGTRYPWVFNGRLFVPEDQGAGNNRVLVFNNIPTVNNAYADIVIGQSSFSGSSANQGGAKAANTLNRPTGGYTDETRTIIVDRINSRLLIYNDVLSSPEIRIDSPETLSNSDIKINGSVILGERGRYFLQKIQSSINGQGFNDVTYKSSGSDDGLDSTIYTFYDQFNPWAANGTKESWEPNGYTLKIKAVNSNAEESYGFYFYPFIVNKVQSNVVQFQTPKAHWQKLKDNLDSFEFQYKKDGSNTWEKLESSIKLSDSIVDANTGIVTITLNKTILDKKYLFKVVAKDNWGHYQESNYLAVDLNNKIGSSSSSSQVLTTTVQPTQKPAPNLDNTTSYLNAKNDAKSKPGIFEEIKQFFIKIFSFFK